MSDNLPVQHNRRASDHGAGNWSAPTERVIIQLSLVALALAVVIATTLLGVEHDLDKASITAIFGTIGGGTVTAIAHKLSTRS